MIPKSLRGWVIAIALFSIALGILASRMTRRIVPSETRGRWAEQAGKFAEAERAYWEALQRGPVTLPLTVAFLEAHDHARALYAVVDAMPEKIQKNAQMKPEPAMPEPQVRSFFTRPGLPREVVLAARLHLDHAPEEVLTELEIEADKSPPLAWANHILARQAFREGRLRDAADRFEREALAFDRPRDLEESLALRMAAGDAAGVDARLSDPRIAPRAPPGLVFKRAIEERAYGRALRYLLPFTYRKPGVGPLLLALVSACAWFVFCARLGRLIDKPALRGPLYLAAFALGTLSLAPTMFLIVWQDVVLHLKPDGTPLKDGAFFVLGVGFREELSKLLCFVPLVPILRRRGSALEVVTCGALVGLGFAAMENLQYFAQGDLGAALGRFLTANFLHMSMTALTASAFAGIGRKEEWFHDFTVRFLTVVGLHGVYDFFLVSPILGDLSFLAMAVFVLLARDFVLLMHDARLRAGGSQPLLPPFAIGTAVVCGASFVYGSVVVGPQLAAEAMYLGLLGTAIVLIVFVRQLSVL